MTIKIVVAPIVAFDVRGVLLDEAGQEQAFDFRLKAKRLDADEVQKRFAPGSSELLTELICDLVNGWEGVIGDSGELLPYSSKAMRQLLKQYVGLAQLIVEMYLDASRVKRKN